MPHSRASLAHGKLCHSSVTSTISGALDDVSRIPRVSTGSARGNEIALSLLYTHKLISGQL